MSNVVDLAAYRAKRKDAPLADLSASVWEMVRRNLPQSDLQAQRTENKDNPLTAAQREARLCRAIAAELQAQRTANDDPLARSKALGDALEKMLPPESLANAKNVTRFDALDEALVAMLPPPSPRVAQLLAESDDPIARFNAHDAELGRLLQKLWPDRFPA